MLLGLYLIAAIVLLYSFNLPPIGPHDHSLTLIHLQALNLLHYASHPPTLPFIVELLYGYIGANYRVVRLMAALFAALIPVSAYMLAGRGKAGLFAYIGVVFSPMYLIYGKAPLYALFGFS
ncbi:MAG: hypothetical protein GXO29_05920, partial [Thermotogae bacterium]|nr:hypothetical protein [Thermotogota bacterium]